MCDKNHEEKKDDIFLNDLLPNPDEQFTTQGNETLTTTGKDDEDQSQTQKTLR